MRRNAAIALSVSLLMSVGACTADDATDQDNHKETACEELLGASGVDWVKDNTEAETGVAPESDDLESAKSLFATQAKSWDPSSDKVPLFSSSELCQVAKRSNSAGASLSIRFGASVIPFDHPFEQDQIETTVNPDVKLVYEKDTRERKRYFVYVKCQVEGAPANQKNEVPLEGVMTDTLTSSHSADDHLNYLLHSARKVVKSFDCQNSPLVPETVPDQIK